MGPPGAPQAPYPGKQYLIGGNWKCNGTKESTAALVATLNGAGDIPAWCEVVVGVPSIHIGSVLGTLRKDIAVAAQDCSATGMGAYTGELSAAMLADYGVKWVILGHSERRTNQNESSAVWKSTSKLGHPENYCGDFCEPPRHRTDAATATTSRRCRGIATPSRRRGYGGTSRRWRGAPEV